MDMKMEIYTDFDAIDEQGWNNLLKTR